MTAAPQLLLTDEQLTLLGDLAGAPGFPAARRPQLDGAGWRAVAHGLLARGFIHDGDPGAEVRAVDAVLGVVLQADRWLWIAIDDREQETSGGHEILWLEEDLRVRQTVTANGLHRFSTATADELLAEAVKLPASAGTAAPAAAAGAAADGLMAGARRVTSVECSRRSDGERVEGETLTLVESRAGELWLLERDDDGAVVLEPVSADAARAQLASLAAVLG